MTKQKDQETVQIQNVEPAPLRFLKIQQNLKASKGQINDFGGYSYRSCEDILASLKPLMAEHGFFINQYEEVELVGNERYIKSTTTLYDCYSDWKIESKTCAREAFEKKKCDASQLTGMAISYARKYGLGGLLGIDDTKDADATNDHGSNNGHSNTRSITPKIVPPEKNFDRELKENINKIFNSLPEKERDAIIENNKSMAKMNREERKNLLKELEKTLNKLKQKAS